MSKPLPPPRRFEPTKHCPLYNVSYVGGPKDGETSQGGMGSANSPLSSYRKGSTVGFGGQRDERVDEYGRKIGTLARYLCTRVRGSYRDMKVTMTFTGYEDYEVLEDSGDR